MIGLLMDETLFKILQRHLNVSKDVPVDTKLENLESDSLILVEIILEIEEKYNIRIDESDAEEIDTVEGLLNLIKKYSTP
jgi:acyl carrier protein